MGSIGIFIAHSLAGLTNPPPITLLMHHPNLYEAWNNKADRRMRLRTHDIQVYRQGFDVDLLTGDGWWENRDDMVGEGVRAEGTASGEPIIQSLILTVKAGHAVRALRSVAHRLTSQSTILLLQNGMGVVEDINEEVFTDPEFRPNYMLGINTHGVFRPRPWTAVHAGFGTMSLSIVRDPQKHPVESQSENAKDAQRTNDDSAYPASARHILRTITRTPVLAATGFMEIELLQIQLEKLAINAVINPLTAMVDCENGELLHNKGFSRTMRLLIAEISAVFRALPELHAVPNARMRFSPERLETLCIGVANRTAKNRSSMLEDVVRGQLTEIEYINGYVVKRGEEQGLKCVMNYMLMQMILGKTQQVKRRLEGDVPIEMIE